MGDSLMMAVSVIRLSSPPSRWLRCIPGAGGGNASCRPRRRSARRPARSSASASAVFTTSPDEGTNPAAMARSTQQSRPASMPGTNTTRCATVSTAPARSQPRLACLATQAPAKACQIPRRRPGQHGEPARAMGEHRQPGRALGDVQRHRRHTEARAAEGAEQQHHQRSHGRRHRHIGTATWAEAANAAEPSSARPQKRMRYICTRRRGIPQSSGKSLQDHESNRRREASARDAAATAAGKPRCRKDPGLPRAGWRGGCAPRKRSPKSNGVRAYQTEALNGAVSRAPAPEDHRVMRPAATPASAPSAAASPIEGTARPDAAPGRAAGPPPITQPRSRKCGSLAQSAMSNSREHGTSAASRMARPPPRSSSASSRR